MEIILVGIYSFFVWLIFIKFKLLPWTTPWKVTVVIIPIIGLSAMILALNTDAAVEKFTKGEREWEMGVDASVAVAKVGAGGALDTTNLKKDIVSFIFGDKGLMGDVSFSGSRFKKQEVE